MPTHSEQKNFGVCLISYLSRRDFPSKYSLGSLRLAAYLSPSTDVSIIPISLDWPAQKAAERIANTQHSIIALPCYSWTIGKSREIAQLLSSSSRIVVAGGPQITYREFSPVDWPKSTIFISGDGEEALKELSCNGPYYKIPGLFNSTAFMSDVYVARHNLEYPVPLNPGEIFKITNDDNPFIDGFVWWETSRGCPFTCGFCRHQQGRNVRTFNPNFLEQELKHLAHFSPKRMFVVDPNLGGTRRGGKAVLKMLQKALPDTAITAYLRPELLDEEYKRILSDSNIDELHIGIQTTNPRIAMGVRGNKYSLIDEHLPGLSEVGIPWRAELIIGLPGDDLEGFRESLRYTIEQLKPTSLYTYHLTVLKGTLMDRIALGEIQKFSLTKEPITNRALESSSYSHEEMLKMLQLGGGISSLYRFMEHNNWLGKEDSLRHFSSLERLVHKMLLKFPHSDEVFQQDRREESQKLWQIFIGAENV